MTSKGLPDSVKLLFGAGGIYTAFIYYGSLQEDVFRYTAVDGSKFKEAWFLQVLEALANVIIGFVGMKLMGQTKGIPLKMFGISGASQVTAKAHTKDSLSCHLEEGGMGSIGRVTKELSKESVVLEKI